MSEHNFSDLMRVARRVLALMGNNAVLKRFLHALANLYRLRLCIPATVDVEFLAGHAYTNDMLDLNRLARFNPIRLRCATA